MLLRQHWRKLGWGNYTFLSLNIYNFYDFLRFNYSIELNRSSTIFYFCAMINCHHYDEYYQIHLNNKNEEAGKFVLHTDFTFGEMKMLFQKNCPAVQKTEKGKKQMLIIMLEINHIASAGSLLQDPHPRAWVLFNLSDSC